MIYPDYATHDKLECGAAARGTPAVPRGISNLGCCRLGSSATAAVLKPFKLIHELLSVDQHDLPVDHQNARLPLEPGERPIPTCSGGGSCRFGRPSCQSRKEQRWCWWHRSHSIIPGRAHSLTHATRGSARMSTLRPARAAPAATPPEAPRPWSGRCTHRRHAIFFSQDTNPRLRTPMSCHLRLALHSLLLCISLLVDRFLASLLRLFAELRVIVFFDWPRKPIDAGSHLRCRWSRPSSRRD